MPWTWSDKSHRYHDSATGRFMGKAEVLGYVQDSLDSARTAPASTLVGGVNSAGTDLLSNLVSNEMMNPRDWHEMMREETKREVIRQYMLGRGGRGSMTAVDWGSCGGIIADQYRYLKDFAKLVEEGALSEGQIRARSAMYINSAREGFERGQARAYGLPELPAYPGDGKTICLTNCACSWEIEEVYDDAGNLIGWNCYWTLGIVKTEHCPDCLENTGKWNPLFITAGGEIVEEPTAPEVPPTPAPAETPPTPEARPVPDQETSLRQDLADAQAAYDGALATGNTIEAEGIKSYMDTARSSLGQEQEINAALWERLGLTPDQATAADWQKLASQFEQEGYSLYKQYTKEGIQHEVTERRGAQDSGYASVGKEVILVKEGRFSRAEAQRLEGELWQQAKTEIKQAFGDLLVQAGYAADDIDAANYEQRRKLLEELGNKDLMRTASGKVSKIDKVPEDARMGAVEAIYHDLASTCGAAAEDPLNLPTLDAWGKMELADVIKTTKVGGHTGGGGEIWLY